MRSIGMYLSGEAPEIRDASGVRVTDDDFIILFNSHHETIDFKLPEEVRGGRWTVAFDTARPEIETGTEPVAKETFQLIGRSLAVLMNLKA